MSPLTAAAFQDIIDTTDLKGFGTRYQGKVRDNYTSGDRRIIIATDRLSCFDRVVTTVPYKGRVLTQLALWWFEKTAHVFPNHVIGSPHPNVVVAKNCEVIPVEVIVRSYLAGSAWRDYEAGRPVSGLILPKGLKNYQKLDNLIVTPSTKADIGTHDLPISEKEILERKIVAGSMWQAMREGALALFKVAEEEAKKRGLLLVDTKYEFGLYKNEVILVDEIHTLDSSRFWLAEDYEARLEAGEPPRMLDKEPVRQWLLQQGFKGDGPIPPFSDEYRLELSRHYLDSYKKITGEQLDMSAPRNLEDALRGN